MSNVEFKMRAAEDRASVRLEVWLDGTLRVWADIEAANLSAMIEQFAQMRAALSVEVPKTLEPGTPLIGVPDPIWRTPSSHPDGARVLSLRHPGLGWTTWVLPLHEAKAIAAELLADHPISKQPSLN